MFCKVLNFRKTLGAPAVQTFCLCLCLCLCLSVSVPVPLSVSWSLGQSLSQSLGRSLAPSPSPFQVRLGDTTTHPGHPPGLEVQPVRGSCTTASPNEHYHVHQLPHPTPHLRRAQGTSGWGSRLGE